MPILDTGRSVKEQELVAEGEKLQKASFLIAEEKERGERPRGGCGKAAYSSKVPFRAKRSKEGVAK